MSVAEFQKLHNEMSALREAGKMDETSKYICDDALFITPLYDEPYTNSQKDKIHEAAKSLVTAKTAVTCTNVKVFGNIAIDSGYVTITHEGKQTKCSYLVVWRKDGGSWKMSHLSFNMRK